MSRAVSFAQFWNTFLRVPSQGGKLAAPKPHREQLRFIEAMDARRPDGLRRYREFFKHASKKTSKSFDGAAAAIYHLTSDPLEPHDRLIGIAAYDEEQAHVIYDLARQIVASNKWLTDNVRVLRGEMIYKERVRDQETGGTYTREHRLRALSHDTRGLHGQPWSMSVLDELWTAPSWELAEAMIPSPTRVSPITLYLTYSGLASQMKKPGVPWVDLLRRAQLERELPEQERSLFYSYIGGEGADAPWVVCPWISKEWIDGERRKFEHCPSRFRRVLLNEVVSGDGDSLLSAADIESATDGAIKTGPALHVHAPVTVYAGLDLGVANDHAALVLQRPDAVGRVIVEHVKVWAPKPGQPVNLMDVEAYILSLRSSYRFERLLCDAWNASLLQSRLQAAGLPARLVTVEQVALDRIITSLKGLFSARKIIVPESETYLIEQLESLRVLEARNARRDLVKFAPSGSGISAGEHDDAAVALGLSIMDGYGRQGMRADRNVGHAVMAPMTICGEETANNRGLDAGCYLWGGMRLPRGPVCAECPGNVSTKAARNELSPGMDLREFVRLGRIRPNQWIATRQLHHAFSLV